MTACTGIMGAGTQVGRLTLNAYTQGRRGNLSKGVPRQAAYWDCTCQCGTSVRVRHDELMRGRTRSCGCLARELASERRRASAKPGIRTSDTATYKVWKGMKERCHSANSSMFHLYGARGIQVCDRWRESFANFLSDMGERPNGMSLDRIDPDGNYEPSNCRWADSFTQNNNRRSNVRIEHQGKSQTVAQWAAEKGSPDSRVERTMT